MLEFGAFAKDLLITGVEEEDERNHSMGGSIGLVERILSGANRLQCEEQKHSSSRSEEEKTTANTLDEE